MDDIQSVVSGMGEAFEEFKKSYDQKLANVKQGVNDPLLDEKISRIESKLDSYENVNQQITLQKQQNEEIKEQMERMETVLRRPSAGMDSEDRKSVV